MLTIWLLAGALLLVEIVLWRALRHRPRHLRLCALALAPLLVLMCYARFAPLESPYDRLERPGVVVLDANGVVLQRDTRSGLRVPVRLEDVAPIMAQATIAAEDERFRSHPGIDPLAIARAIVRFPFERSGASTLTQQLARRLYLDDSMSVFERKTREALLALQLESRYSKDEILALYLNEVYYGRGASGVEAAARTYFGVSAGNLDLAQAAFLAGLPQRPAYYGDESHADAARARQRYVLQRLVARGDATPQQAAAALAEPVALLPQHSPVIAPHFVTFALEELARLRPDLAREPGLVIETTLDAGLQEEARLQVTYQLSRLEDKAVANAAVVVLEPATGRVLAMVGNADFDDESASGQVNMALQPRQPGSALKPFLYATAFERGFTAATPLLDVPSTFQTPGGRYEPLNFDRRFNGPVSLRTALASSLNVPAVRTLDQVGVDALLETAHRFGLNTLTDAEVYGLALTLGGGEVRLLDLTAAYAALANGGVLQSPHAVARVRDGAGDIVFEQRPEVGRRVVSEEHAFILADILSDASARELGFGPAPALRLPFRSAVKTGTTTEFRDNWTLGFTPERVAGVWVGNADNRPMRDVSGIEGAGPIWHGVMQAALKGTTPTWPSPPATLRQVTVCDPTGMLPGSDCPARLLEWFVAGSEPGETEAYYRRDERGRLLINPPSAARGWAAAAGFALFEGEISAEATPFVVQPSDGSVLFLALELGSRSLLLKASPPRGASRVEFRVDGALVGSALPDNPTAVWQLTLGRHLLEVTAVLASGGSVTSTSSYEVRQ